MHTEAGQVYHLYNQGNNKEVLFTNQQDYLQFLRLARRHLLPVCDILAWCLMPNHFHFCIRTTDSSTREVQSGKFFIQAFSKGVGLLLSAYATIINKREDRTGARFRPHTKLKLLTEEGEFSYPAAVIRYIHDNPVAAGLVATAEEWPYSSALDYAGLRPGKLCNLGLVRQLGLLYL